MKNEELYHKLTFVNESLKRKTKNDKTISRGQGRILAILKHKDAIATRDLAEILNISVSALNETLNKLEKNGYISKTPSSKDKRILLIRLTNKGHEYEFKPNDLSIFDCLNDDEKENFVSYLDKLINEINEELRRKNPKKYDEMMRTRQKIFNKYFKEDN